MMSQKRIAASRAKALHRLDGHLRREFGRLHHLKKTVLLPDRLVLGQVPAGLPHHPDGRAVGGLPAGGAEKAVVVEGRKGGHMRDWRSNGMNRY
jgi:hypothetical protein